MTSYSPPFPDVLIPREAGRCLRAPPGVPSIIPPASGSLHTGHRSGQETLGQPDARVCVGTSPQRACGFLSIRKGLWSSCPLKLSVRHC